MDELAKKDKTFQLYQQRAERLMAKPLPTRVQKSAAWAKVVSAYHAWLQMEADVALRERDLEDLEVLMRRRMVFLKDQATRNMIHKIRMKLGPRYAEIKKYNPKLRLPLHALRSKRNPAGSLIEPSRRSPTVSAPSTSPAGTTALPPPPSA